MDNIALAIAGVSALGVIAHWLAWRFHLPAIITLLVTGLFLGPVFGVMDPSEILGNLMQPLISVAVAVILFEGGLHLKFDELRDAQKSTRHLIIIGAPLGWLLIATSLYYIAGLSAAVSVTFGGILVVTGPTVIMPLLRQARLKSRVASLLKWEGIVNDPIGALFAVVSFEIFVLFKNDDGNIWLFLFKITLLLSIIVLLSLATVKIMIRLFERGHIPEYLKKPFMLATVIGIYVCANFIQHEGGLLAVTVMGTALANSSLSSIDEIRRFKESMAVVLVAGVFIILTASLKIELFTAMSWRDAAFVTVLLIVIRPLTVFISTIGTGLTIQEKLLTGWIAPRGVVCIAVSGLFAPLLMNEGYPDASRMVSLSFFVVMVTVVLHGFSLRYLGKKLNLVYKKSNGIVVVGASDWTVQLAEILLKYDIPVTIIDRSWAELKYARLQSVPAYFGEILSEETEYSIDFAKYNCILAATDNSAYNALVCSKFVHDFGRDNVYRLSVPEDEDRANRSIKHTINGRCFVHRELGRSEWADMFRSGWRFKATSISEDFNYEHFCELNSDSIHVGIIGEKGSVRFAKPEVELKPKKGEIFISFTYKAEESGKKNEENDETTDK